MPSNHRADLPVDALEAEMLVDERERIARDLHYLVVQRLFAMGMTLQGVEQLCSDPAVVSRIRQMVDEVDDMVIEIRHSVFNLGRQETGADIRAEVGRIVDRAVETMGIRSSLHFDGPLCRLTADEVIPDLLAVLVEALSNAHRHGRSTTVDVSLTAGSDLVLQVRDDGCGFEGQVVERGLRHVRDRAARYGGSCEILSAPGTGTTLRWSVPLAPPISDGARLPDGVAALAASQDQRS